MKTSFLLHSLLQEFVKFVKFVVKKIFVVEVI